MQRECDEENKIVLSALSIASVSRGERGTIVVAAQFRVPHVYIVRQSVDDVLAMLAEARAQRGLFSGTLTLDLVEDDSFD